MRIIEIGLIVVIMVSASARLVENLEFSGPKTINKIGGWHEIPLANKEVYQEAQKFMIQNIPEFIQGYELLQVYKQVVAGFNYKFLVKSHYGKNLEIIVYKDL